MYRCLYRARNFFDRLPGIYLTTLPRTCRQMHAETALMVFSCGEFFLTSAAIDGFLTALQPQQRDAIKRVVIPLGYVEGGEYHRMLIGTDWSILSAFAGLERVTFMMFNLATFYRAAKTQETLEALKQIVGKNVKIVFMDYSEL
jgi:hypothetical protein